MSMTSEKCQVYRVVSEVAGLLGIDLADADMTRAYLSATGLLLAFGVEPLTDPADTSPAANQVRDLLLEGQTRTTTRSRRSV
jgi:hypothetical protein